MANLKPRLMMTQSGRKRRGFGKLLFVLIIFAAGFYAGSKYGDNVFQSIAPQTVQNVSEIEGSGNVLQEQSVNQESIEQVSMENYSNPDVHNEEDQAFLTVEAQVETESPYASQNDLVDSNESAGNGLIANDESVYSLELGNTQDNDFSADNPDETSKTEGLYTLQVAAFSTPDEANSVVEQYIAKGYKAYVVPIENSRGETWNLVKIGRFNTIEQAWSYSTYFKNREGTEAFVESLEQETVFNESWQNSEQAERD